MQLQQIKPKLFVMAISPNANADILSVETVQ